MSMFRLALLSLVALPMTLAAADRQIMGWVEHMVVDPGFAMEAKLDSGALTSSMHATNIERFERDGDEWVRFSIHDGNGGGVKQLERPLVRNVLIKRHGAASQRRPVVELEFCLAGATHSAQFSLVDRSNFLYPVLLGRRFLQDVALVDSAARGLTGEACLAEAARD